MQEQNQIIEEIKEAIKLERKDKANRDRCIVLYKEIFRDYCRLTIESVDEIGEIRIEEYNNAWWEDRQKQKQTAIIYQQFSTSRYITIAKHFFDKIIYMPVAASVNSKPHINPSTNLAASLSRKRTALSWVLRIEAGHFSVIGPVKVSFTASAFLSVGTIQ